MKFLKNAFIPFYKPNTIGPYLGLSNEILCILVAQGVAELPEVKV